MLEHRLYKRPGNGRTGLGHASTAERFDIEIQRQDPDRCGRDEAKALGDGPSHRVFRSLVFADFANYSRLPDSQVSLFLEVLAEVARALEPVRPADSYVRTVGDGIFAVMRTATEAANFALTLSRTAEKSGAFLRDQNAAIPVRIALHCGLVILAEDPIAKAPGYYGAQVNRAARLEHVTPPGLIYATTEFVEVLKREAPTRLLGLEAGGSLCTCEYFGRVTLAKGFGVQGVYEVRGLGGRDARN